MDTNKEVLAQVRQFVELEHVLQGLVHIWHCTESLNVPIGHEVRHELDTE